MTLTHGICHSKAFGPKRIIQKRFLSIQNNLVHTMTARPINEDSYMHDWRTRIRTCNADDIMMWDDWDTLPDIDLATLIQEVSREGMQLATRRNGGDK